jgi:hydroxymethylbilane synthase
MKDVPTLLPKGIVQSAVLKRASSQDILVTNGELDYKKVSIIATGSLRRKAQWLNQYPHHKVVGLRGNVITRLNKLNESDWQGAIFAQAGLERIEVLPKNHIKLDWMIPAPSQGAMVIVALENDSFSQEATAKLNDKKSEICTFIEREFLRVLEGGCTAPIGAIATLNGNKIDFKGVLLSLDGTKKLEIGKSISVDNNIKFGAKCAQEILANGGQELMRQIKAELK